MQERIPFSCASLLKKTSMTENCLWKRKNYVPLLPRIIQFRCFSQQEGKPLTYQHLGRESMNSFPPVVYYTGTHQNKDTRRTKIVMLMKLQALNILSEKLMVYVIPALQLWPLRSSATNTVPKAFKNTLTWLHLPFEHAVGLWYWEKLPDS